MNICTMCNDQMEPWTDKYGDLFTHICKACAGRPSDKPSLHGPEWFGA